MHDNTLGAALDGALEPSLTHTLLPRCEACAAPHPLARTPQQPASACPDCGAASTRGRTVCVPASISGRGLGVWLARACFAIAAWLRRLIERI